MITAFVWTIVVIAAWGWPAAMLVAWLIGPDRELHPSVVRLVRPFRWPHVAAVLVLAIVAGWSSAPVAGMSILMALLPPRPADPARPESVHSGTVQACMPFTFAGLFVLTSMSAPVPAHDCQVEGTCDLGGGR